MRLHDIRHGFASMLIAAGTNARIVADLLGHATVAFTLQTYVHPSEEDAATAVATAERLIGPWGESGENRSPQVGASGPGGRNETAGHGIRRNPPEGSVRDS